MTEEFMKANPEKYYFNFREIILQAVPEYVNKDIEEALKKLTDSEDFSEKQKRKIIKENENLYYDPTQKKIKKAMKNLGFDTDLYKDENNHYKIPIIFAEMIYILAKNLASNSAKGSFASRLISNDLKKPTPKEKKNFINDVFEELKKDYPHIASKATEMQKELLYPYNKIKQIENVIKDLNTIKNSIEIPLISFDEKIYDKWDNIFSNMRKDIDNKEYYDYILNHPGHQLIQQFYSLSTTTPLLQYNEELEKSIKNVENSIKKLSKEIEKANVFGETTAKNHLIYVYSSKELPNK